MEEMGSFLPEELSEPENLRDIARKLYHSTSWKYFKQLVDAYKQFLVSTILTSPPDAYHERERAYLKHRGACEILAWIETLANEDLLTNLQQGQS